MMALIAVFCRMLPLIVNQLADIAKETIIVIIVRSIRATGKSAVDLFLWQAALRC